MNRFRTANIAAIIHDENLFVEALFSRFGTHSQHKHTPTFKRSQFETLEYMFTFSFAIIHFVFSSNQLVVVIVAVNFPGVTATFCNYFHSAAVADVVVDAPFSSVSTFLPFILYLGIFQHTVDENQYVYEKFGNICIQDAHFYRL